MATFTIFVGAQNDGRIFFCASLHPCFPSLETSYIYTFFISTPGLLLTLASCLIGCQDLVTVQATADCCIDPAILGAFSVCPGDFSSLQLEPTSGTYLYCLIKAKLFIFDATYSCSLSSLATFPSVPSPSSLALILAQVTLLCCSPLSISPHGSGLVYVYCVLF